VHDAVHTGKKSHDARGVALSHDPRQRSRHANTNGHPRGWPSSRPTMRMSPARCGRLHHSGLWRGNQRSSQRHHLHG